MALPLEGKEFKIKFNNGSEFNFHLGKYNNYNYELKRTGFSSAGSIHRDKISKQAVLEAATKWSSSNTAVEVIGW